MHNKIIKYSKNNIELLKESLVNGEVIAVPTDTVYGLVANAYNEKAVNKIFQIKSRPKKLPLIIFVASLADAKKIGYFSKREELIAKAFWPGDLTLVVKKKNKKIFYGHNLLATVGIRIPKHKALLTLLKEINIPLASTSANVHGGKIQKDIDKLEILGKKNLSYALTSMHKIEGNESTIVSLENDKVKIIRKGRIGKKIIEKLLKHPQKH